MIERETIVAQPVSLKRCSGTKICRKGIIFVIQVKVRVASLIWANALRISISLGSIEKTIRY